MFIKMKLDFGPVQGFRIGSAYLGKPLMSVICYQVGDSLIDTGPSNARHLLMDLLDPNVIRGIYLTHYHEDHAGNAAFLKQRFHIPVYGHPLTARALQQKIRLKPYEKYMWGTLDPLAVIPLAETFGTDGYQFSVIHTPGHSIDHVVYLEKNQGWLFSGDMYLGARIKYFRSDEDICETIASLKKIAALNPEKLFCGHNPQLEQPLRAIHRKIDHLETIYGNVRHLYHEGVPPDDIVRRLLKGNEFWPAKIITLGDVSYKNMLLSSLKNLTPRAPE